MEQPYGIGADRFGPISVLAVVLRAGLMAAAGWVYATRT
jgi:hypothetical protein